MLFSILTILVEKPRIPDHRTQRTRSVITNDRWSLIVWTANEHGNPRSLEKIPWTFVDALKIRTNSGKFGLMTTSDGRDIDI